MKPSGRDVCRSIFYILFGPSNFYFDQLLHTIINHIPAGASYKQFIHYGQIAVSRKHNSNILSEGNLFLFFFHRIDSISFTGRFQQFHHGTEKNMRIYGAAEPPLYNLSNVRANIHIMHGLNDWLTPSDVRIFRILFVSPQC